MAPIHLFGVFRHLKLGKPFWNNCLIDWVRRASLDRKVDRVWMKGSVSNRRRLDTEIVYTDSSTQSTENDIDSIAWINPV